MTDEQKQTLEAALEKVRQTYEEALKNPYIFNPIGFALYRVWDECNSRFRDKDREEKEW